MYYPSANRDERVFDNAVTFDIGRDPNPHIGFGGGGPHFCLGRHLAKLEIELMLESLARKVDKVELTAPIDRLRSQLHQRHQVDAGPHHGQVGARVEPFLAAELVTRRR